MTAMTTRIVTPQKARIFRLVARLGGQIVKTDQASEGPMEKGQLVGVKLLTIPGRACPVRIKSGHSC